MHPCQDCLDPCLVFAPELDNERQEILKVFACDPVRICRLEGCWRPRHGSIDWAVPTDQNDALVAKGYIAVHIVTRCRVVSGITD